MNCFKKLKFGILLKYLNGILDFLVTILSISTIHGLNHIIKKGYHPVERFIWLILVSVSAYAVFSVSKISLDRYKENPTVISVERNSHSSNISSPTVTICPHKKVDEVVLRSYLNSSKDITDKHRYREFVMSLLNATYENLDQIVEYENVTGEEFVGIIEKFKYRFISSFPKSNVNLQISLSELGVCYSYNSQVAIYSSFKNWNADINTIISQNATIYISSVNGETMLTIGDLATGYRVYFHGPYEVPDISSTYMEAKVKTFLTVTLKTFVIFITDRAKQLQINQRKCRIYYENNLRHSSTYSYVLCRMDCRARLSKKLCGCVPHFYRKVGGDQVCGFKGLRCLNLFKDRLIYINEDCSCLQNCEEVYFSLDEWDTQDWFLSTEFKWGIKHYSNMRLKRDIIFGFSDLLVYVGGIAGLFLGCSILSIIEIFYFFTLRLYWFIVRYGA